MKTNNPAHLRGWRVFFVDGIRNRRAGSAHSGDRIGDHGPSTTRPDSSETEPTARPGSDRLQRGGGKSQTSDEPCIGGHGAKSLPTRRTGFKVCAANFVDPETILHIEGYASASSSTA